MIEVGIDVDEIYPYYAFYITNKVQFQSSSEARFLISEQALQEFIKLQESLKLYQTKLKQLFELHGGVI